MAHWRYAGALLAGAALTLLAAGCEGKKAPRADLVFINGAEPETLDPALMSGQSDMRLAYALFEGLTSFDADGQPRPGVAARWDVSPDGTQYTFHLRPDARWSDGQPVTAPDFVRSWQRVLTPANAAQYAGQLYCLKNGQRFNDPDAHLTDFNEVGVHALDDATLRVELEHATPYFLDLCCLPAFAPVPREAVARWGDAWTRPEHIVTDGPFLLETWRLNERIRLRRNPGYWDRAAVHLETVDALPINQANVALNFFSSGLADLIMDKGLVPPHLVGELRRKAYFHSAPFLGDLFLRFNCTRPPFNDSRVRQALALVIDKRLITEKITKAGEVPADGFVPPGTAGYRPPGTFLGYNPARARTLLAAAGYPGGKGFPPFAFLYNEGEQNKYIGIELKSMFERELGIVMGLRPLENKVYLSSMGHLDYDLARSSWVGDYDDPNTFLEMWVTGSGNNRCGWSDAGYDALITQAASETDHARRLEIFQRAETILVRDQTPICPLYYYVGIQLYDDHKLGGLRPNLLDVHPVRDMYLRKK